jgi:cytochrome P450
LNGPFVLGMDRGEVLARERRQMYAALVTVDLTAIQDQVCLEARRLLSTAIGAGARIDVVNGYARLVAARTAVLLFGVPGPSEAALTTSARAAFEQLFLNLSNKPKVREHALIAAAAARAMAERRDRAARRGGPAGWRSHGCSARPPRV